MSALPEARLAREAEICYAIIACSTDYDSWHETGAAVSVEIILSTLRANIDMSKKIIRLAVGRMPQKRDCDCSRSLKNAIVTPAQAMPRQQRKKLGLLIDKYLSKGGG